MFDDDNLEQVVDTESSAWQRFSTGSRRSSPGTGDRQVRSNKGNSGKCRAGRGVSGVMIIMVMIRRRKPGVL